MIKNNSSTIIDAQWVLVKSLAKNLDHWLKKNPCRQQGECPFFPCQCRKSLTDYNSAVERLLTYRAQCCAEFCIDEPEIELEQFRRLRPRSKLRRR
jgi:hypothetical protein